MPARPLLLKAAQGDAPYASILAQLDELLHPKQSSAAHVRTGLLASLAFLHALLAFLYLVHLLWTLGKGPDSHMMKMRTGFANLASHPSLLASAFLPLLSVLSGSIFATQMILLLYGSDGASTAAYTLHALCTIPVFLQGWTIASISLRNLMAVQAALGAAHVGHTARRLQLLCYTGGALFTCAATACGISACATSIRLFSSLASLKTLMAALNQPTINSNYLPLLSLGSPLTSLRESAVSLQHAFVAADSVGLAMAQAVLALSIYALIQHRSSSRLSRALARPAPDSSPTVSSASSKSSDELAATRLTGALPAAKQVAALKEARDRVLVVSLGTAFLSAVFVGLFAHSLRLSALGQIILSPGYNLVTPLIGIVSFFALVQAALFAFLLYDERVSGAHVLSGHQDALCTRVVRWVGTVRSWRVRRKRAIVVPESQQDESTVIELVAPAPRRRDLDD